MNSAPGDALPEQVFVFLQDTRASSDPMSCPSPAPSAADVSPPDDRLSRPARFTSHSCVVVPFSIDVPVRRLLAFDSWRFTHRKPPLFVVTGYCRRVEGLVSVRRTGRISPNPPPETDTTVGFLFCGTQKMASKEPDITSAPRGDFDFTPMICLHDKARTRCCCCQRYADV